MIAFGFLIRNIQQENHFNPGKREILLRKIGHEILLQSGDSSSRVLPVRKFAGEKYELRFERQFSFEPDSLVAIVRKSLTQTPGKPDYIVNVKDCSGTSIVYGYVVSQQQKNDIIPCRGRKQPSDCYIISIEFNDFHFEIKEYAAGGLLFAIVILFPFILFLHRKEKKPYAAILKTVHNSVYIGSILFDTEKKCLIVGNETIPLTAKENKLLRIFAQNQNQIVDRARLQKEIWEDDGIIVGRSLDVFISKLRKKLESDPSVQLINIHGKGYKLQIDQQSE